MLFGQAELSLLIYQRASLTYRKFVFMLPQLFRLASQAPFHWRNATASELMVDHEQAEANTYTLPLKRTLLPL